MPPAVSLLVLQMMVALVVQLVGKYFYGKLLAFMLVLRPLLAPCVQLVNGAINITTNTIITTATITNLIVTNCTGCAGTSTFDIFVSSTAGDGTDSTCWY